MTTNTKIKIRSETIRDELLNLAEEFVFAFSHKNYMDFAQYKDMQHYAAVKEQRKLQQELKRRKWIETKTIGNRVMTRFTEQGWQHALRRKIRTETKICKKGICIVVFDIPESERFVRNVLRSFLKEWGFEKLQHSVWITERDVVKPMMLLLQRRGLDKWIRVIQGTVLKPSLLDPIHARVTR